MYLHFFHTPLQLFSYICENPLTQTNAITMKTITIPFEFSMDNCSWFDNCGTRQYTVQVELTEEEANDLSLPHVHQKLEDAVNNECKRISYRYALINEFEENEVMLENEEKMMDVFAKEGLFDPDECYGGIDKSGNFGIWLNEEKLAYKCSFVLPTV